MLGRAGHLPGAQEKVDQSGWLNTIEFSARSRI